MKGTLLKVVDENGRDIKLSQNLPAGTRITKLSKIVPPIVIVVSSKMEPGGGAAIKASRSSSIKILLYAMETREAS